jgi:hypothetical protein
MYSDNNFFAFIICIFVIVGISQTLLSSCNIGIPIRGICNLFIVILYPILIYLVINSIKETKKSKYKNTRYLLNGLTIFILFLVLLFNVKLVLKFKFKKRVEF